jgi:hypothetical protein
MWVQHLRKNMNVCSCTHQLPHSCIMKSAACENLALHASGNVQSLQTQNTHTSRPAQCSCDLAKHAVTYQGLFCSTAHISYTWSRWTDERVVGNYRHELPDTNRDSTKFALLPNVLTNSKDFPFKLTSNGAPLYSCKHTNIWFLSSCVHMHDEQRRNVAYFN